MGVIGSPIQPTKERHVLVASEFSAPGKQVSPAFSGVKPTDVDRVSTMSC